MEPILPGAPWLIAHKSMLGINKPNKITLNGNDYVIWQNQKGEVFALDNICPHLQAPLSDGWVCKERDTITCPFHALEFDPKGRLYQEGKDVQPITQPLELIIINDCIWTYGGMKPRLQIPELHQRIVDEYEFVGITGEKSIQADFLSNLMVNYDYNHQNGTHKEMFKITTCNVSSFEENGYYSKVHQEIIRSDNTLGEIIKNPALGIMPKVMNNILEYAFPSTTVFFGDTSIASVAQTQIIYPETENRTKTFVLLYANFKNPLSKLLKNSFLQAASTVIDQDTTAVESLYPRQKSKIRLPNEEIMFYAEKLYRNW